MTLWCLTACPPVLADPGRLESALLNIAINARDAMHSGALKRRLLRRHALRPARFAKHQLKTCSCSAVKDGAKRIGEHIALARKRRRLTLREIASKAGISYDTARAVEAGNLQTGLGAYLALLWGMGLESEINAFVNPERDDEGKQLEIARLPQRVRHGKERLDGEF